MTKRITIYTLLIFNVITTNYSSAQDSILYVIPKLYGFENILKDSITNNKMLTPIYESLYQLKTNPSKITFFHFGDSHLQADYISHSIRTSLHKKFGNAGRGLIAPLKIAKTNESFNYSTQSKNNFKRQLIIAKKLILPVGVTGVTIQSRDTIGEIKIKTFDTDSLDYSFNKATLYFNQDSAFTLEIKDSIRFWERNKTNQAIFSSTFDTHEVSILFKQRDTIQKNITFFGCSLENGNSGIIYHSTGINGAKYADYNKSTLFLNQMKMLNPKLVIVSLGTNESFQPDFDTTRFYLTIDTLIKNIKETNPETIILLTTPACSFKNHKKNTNLKLVSNTIVEYASKNHLPYWDLNSITGGENSAIDWKKNLLLSKDGVHFTKNGYRLQGQLFNLAFINGYNEYVKHRLQ